MLRYVFYTFRPHPLDLQKFEDYCTLLLPFIESHPHYAYSIEKDDTPDRHLHALMGSPAYKDLSKFTQAYHGKKRGLKAYKDMITRGKQTSALHAWDTRLLPDTDDDFKKTLGYIYKDANSRMETNFPIETLTASVEHYWSSRRLNAHSPTEHNWIFLTRKNAYQHIPDFLKKFQDKYKLTGLLDSRLPQALSKECYALADLTPKTYGIIIQQLAHKYEACPEPMETEIDRIFTPHGEHPNDTYYIDKCHELHKRLRAASDKYDFAYTVTSKELHPADAASYL